MVDDEPGFRSLIAATLAKAYPNAVVEGASDGEAGLDAALAHPPALVVTDLDMPRMNGVELTAALRADPRTAVVPIVVATGVGGATDWRVLSALGADGFMVKPFDPAALVSLVENLLAQEAAWKPARRAS
ncbi:MAG: response regulator [Sandaracinaceae bacterium]|nr:response regulator [Sandaracinaceae bacterium]